MNVFIIPSWYPSKDHLHAGIFTKEQAVAMAHTFPRSNFTLSTWGSHDEDLLLWGKDFLENFPKLLKRPFKKSFKSTLAPNLNEYFSPSFTWSRRIWGGNIQQIIKTNEKHLLHFSQKVGKINILHAHSAYPGGWVAMALGKKYGIPFVITEHMSPFPFQTFLTSNGKLSPYLQIPFDHSFCNIVVSPQQKETMKTWNIPSLHYIPNLTNEEFFKPAPTEERLSKPFTFFTLGSQEARKGNAFLLKAFRQFSDQCPDCFLRIGGEGPQKESYKVLAAKLEISHKVKWLGALHRHEALEEYQQCDAFVLPSLHENLPLVLLEAIACGKPLISTRCGGPESIITPKNGLLVEPGNTETLFRAMVQLHQNFSLYDSKEIREYFCNRYSRPVVCHQIMDVYEEAAGYLGREH